nr:PREDICTED: gamma-parvin [Lepisosteus oculatus]
MDVDINNAFGQDSQQSKPVEDMEGFLGERRKIIQPGSLKDPKLEDLKTRLTDWINTTLKPEHIVVQSLEEDLFDGLVLHHLLVRLAGMKLDVEEIALTAMAQKRKLGVILEAINRVLGLSKEDSQKWSVNLIHNRDLLSTLHLLVAIVKHFQPEMALPSNVCLEVIILELEELLHDVNCNMFYTKSLSSLSFISSGSLDENSQNPIDELLKLEPQKVNTVKQAILHFVNKNMARMGLQVSDIDTQFSDGVILLLLIGQLEDYFVHLSEFYLTPSTNEEMVHNVTLALDLLSDRELQLYNVAPEDIVSQDLTATLTVLYALFKKYKYR